MYFLTEGIIYNQIGKEVIIKSKIKGNTIFLNETASAIFKAIVDGIDVRREIIKKYELSNEEYKIIEPDVEEVLNNLVEIGVVYEC